MNGFILIFRSHVSGFTNLEKINIQSNSPNDKPAHGFAYEIEGSQLIIRSSYFNEESKELKFTVDFLHDTLAKWLVTILEDDIIMCFESTTNVLVILSIRKSLPKSSCKVILLERDSKDSPLTDIWIPAQVEDGYRKFYFVDTLRSIYLLKLDSEWNKSHELKKIQLKQVFNSLEFPEVQKKSHLSKHFEFFLWIKTKCTVLNNGLRVTI